MKAYIAGKITGDPTYKRKFRDAENRLYADGYDSVISPAVLPEGMSSADYMRICFAMIDIADVVVFLPDYTESRGALVEYAYCQYVGKQTLYLGGRPDHGTD